MTQNMKVPPKVTKDDLTARITSTKQSLDRAIAKVDRMKELLELLELARDQLELK